MCVNKKLFDVCSVSKNSSDHLRTLHVAGGLVVNRLLTKPIIVLIDPRTVQMARTSPTRGERSNAKTVLSDLDCLIQ